MGLFDLVKDGVSVNLGNLEEGFSLLFPTVYLGVESTYWPLCACALRCFSQLVILSSCFNSSLPKGCV